MDIIKDFVIKTLIKWIQYYSGVFKIVIRGGEGGKLPLPVGLKFFAKWWELEEGWFWQFKPFSKLKTAFCEYWTSIKIEISTTSVSKEYEIQTKMEQEQWL